MDLTVRRENLEHLGGLAIDPQELLRAIMRRKWLILASAIVVGGAVAVGTMRQPKIYAAEARIVFENSGAEVLGDSMSIDEIQTKAKGESQWRNTQYQILSGRIVLRRVAARLGLEKDKAFLADYRLAGVPEEQLLDRIADRIQGMLKVTPARDSRLVALEVEDRDPLRATKIANTIAQEYMDFSQERRLTSIRDAGKWLDEQAEQYSNKLEAAERALFEFKKEHRLVSLSLQDRQNITAASLTTLTERVVSTRAKLLELESKRKILLAAKDGGQIETAPEIAANAVISNIKQSLHALEKKTVGLATRYGPKHPSMVSLEEQIKSTREHLNREIDVVVASLENEMASMRMLEKELNVAIETEKENAMVLNNLGLEHSKLTRDFGTHQTLYRALLKRQAEADLSARLESNFVNWFQRAEPRLGPVRPSVPLNTAIGALVGLVLGLLIAVAGVLLDTTVHRQSDIEATGIPFLGILPSISNRDVAKSLDKAPADLSVSDKDLYIMRRPNSAVSECARSIRTNLLFMSTDRSLRRVLITSAGPSEGKSTSAVCLGVTMAQAGNRVLLVDTDLRRPRLHASFGVSGERGLTSVLVKDCTLEEAIKATDQVGLDVLPAGPIPPNPAELLHSERFAELQKLLSEKYDRIIFDSPPVNAVADGLILAQTVDGVILVVKAARTTKDHLRRALRQLIDVNANVLGLVLNDLDVRDATYRYYYQYEYTAYRYRSPETKNSEV